MDKILIMQDGQPESRSLKPMHKTQTQERVPVISVLMVRREVEGGDSLRSPSANWPGIKCGDDTGETLPQTSWKVRAHAVC